ncbi:GspE/PulE family protein [Thioalkalivibrio paradoxus]|uniref:GspE/PulE family protein n=1 Tax=Thioalkalivibrio paradoxus TaxID=108010 RepID=UPI0002FED95A|nr:ATPase, T2SS/T4P/T4SS family [Thioalkalivibrio paradoxus]
MGEHLVQANKLSARDLERALAAQQEMGGLLGRVLVKLGLVSEHDVAQALVALRGFAFVEAEHYPEVPLALDSVSVEFLVNHRLLPWEIDDGQLKVITSEPDNEYALKALRLATGYPVAPVLGLDTDIDAALERLYSDDESDQPEADEAVPGEVLDGEFVEHLRDLASEAPVIRLVNGMIAEAVERGASDIHLEPTAGDLQLRFRVDGVLLSGQSVPSGLAPAVTSRVKLLARMNIAERRLPQDGRIMIRLKGHELDLRVSSLPTIHGESVVMRVLDRQSVRYGLDDMGFAPATLRRYQGLLQRPHGILLVTGPTGSGKTTTLYASLGELDSRTRKIVTVEDPVEYQLEGINQIHVHADIGLTFARSLRAILRQDPDIIMIGEMRDRETAQIAVQSALTGHLVLSTLHTNTAAGAIVRLEDMGVERYLITSSVNGVLSQRLVRALCPDCKAPQALESGVLADLRLPEVVEPGQPVTVFEPVGCERCGHTGYRGRLGVHELFVMDEAMHRAVLDGADATTLHATARQAGMRTLHEDGLRKAALGLTSVAEVLRVTQDQQLDA